MIARMFVAAAVLACLPIHSVRAQVDSQYPEADVDGCGGAPGDPPVITFAPGSALPLLDDATDRRRLHRWREVTRPDVHLVLLRGVADTSEAGYAPDLAVRRAAAVRDVLVELHVRREDIWIRGDSVTPATPVEHEAVLARSVTIGDPLRVVDCDRALFAARFRWFTSHCSGQSVAAGVQKTCDMADSALGDASVKGH